MIDVLIIAEGTYPYISGGVSTWIHQLITSIEDMQFGILFLGSREEDYKDVKYKLPKNLTYFKKIFIFEDDNFNNYRKSHGCKGNPEIFMSLFEENIKDYDNFLNPDFYKKDFPYECFLQSKSIYYFIENLYQKLSYNLHFSDFFWTIRNVLTPLWNIFNEIDDVFNEEISLVHSPSTGYAGMLGASIKQKMNIPFILTEHGIYTRERKIDIVQAKWVKEFPMFYNYYDLDPLKRVWTDFFTNLGKISYDKADKIISLYEGARKVQISLGAKPEKTLVIPNGIDVDKLASLRKDSIPKRIAFLGRVVKIKDVKTLIKAFKILSLKAKDVECWIVGPEDEEPDYAKECRELVKNFDLEDKVIFKGFMNIKDLFPHVGLVTLTSISEGMPMVILESFAAGIPFVATDVGSCRQLIEGGLNDEDRAIGPAGFVTKVGDASALAESYYKILYDEPLYKAFQKNAIERVERFYTKENMIKSYKDLYNELMESYGRHRLSA
ncbi:GT4 family glycosyltransferase PelF [Hydrogenobaculum acidophilum]